MGIQEKPGANRGLSFGPGCSFTCFPLRPLLDRTMPHNLVNPLTGFSRKLCGGIRLSAFVVNGFQCPASGLRPSFVNPAEG